MEQKMSLQVSLLLLHEASVTLPFVSVMLLFVDLTPEIISHN